MKQDEEIIQQVEKNPNFFPNFFKETFADLKTNNPYLAGFMSKVVMSNKKDEKISGGTLRMLLIAMKYMGMTDKNDPDFIRISAPSVIEAEKKERPYSVYEGFTRKATELIYSIAQNFNVTFGQVMEYFEVVAQAILLEKNKEKNKENVLTKAIQDLNPEQKNW